MTKALRFPAEVEGRVPVKRTALYALVAQGVIPVRDFGGIKIVLEHELDEALRNAPLARPQPIAA